jgi:UDPglucose 6-dehydrogenase
MKITVIGTGYVGLVTGACLSEVGHDVICLDIDQSKIDMLNEGGIPIFEPGLKSMVVKNHEAGRLSFTTNSKEAIANSDLIMIAVGTPPDEDGSADLSAVLGVAKMIGELMNEHKTIVTKSTVPVGSADKVSEAVQKALDARKSTLTFDVASNPEFLREGRAVEDFMKPDRIIIGADKKEVRKYLEQVYAPFMRSHNRVISMDVRSAELTKYAANAMLATKISFMNEMSNIADRVGADIENVRRGIGSDHRIGYDFIYPGAGYGGSCFPKDVKALGATARQHDYDAKLIDAVEAVNEQQKMVLVEKIRKHFDGALKGRVFALWGLAFKPNTDDMREAPSRVIMEALWEEGAHVQAFDPEAIEEAKRIYGERKDLCLVKDQWDALQGADALIVVTEWKTFQSLDIAKLKERMVTPVIFDGRNIYDKEAMKEAGVEYYAIGRPKD